MVLGSWRLNTIWTFLWNDSGVILEILEIDSESLFNVKVYILNISLDLKLIVSFVGETRMDRFQHEFFVISEVRGCELQGLHSINVRKKFEKKLFVGSDPFRKVLKRHIWQPLGTKHCQKNIFIVPQLL